MVKQRIDRLPVGRFVEHGFGRRSQGGLGIGVAVQIIFGAAKTIVHGRVDLDHVLIAGEEQRLFRFAFEPAGSVLHVPLVGGGFGFVFRERRSGSRFQESELASPARTWTFSTGHGSL